MTDQEIVRALRCCLFGKPCERCPEVHIESCFDKVHTAAADAIERLRAENAALREKVPQWISVEERRPEPGKRVLATDGVFVGEDTGLTPEEIKAGVPEDVVIKLAEQALGTESGRLRELAEADKLVREMEWRADKYINYTAAREKACKGCTSRDGAEGCYSMEPCERLIAEIICAPAADVAPVEHAQWLLDRWPSWPHRECSRCKTMFPRTTEVADQYWQYCPNCGARMDGAAE